MVAIPYFLVIFMFMNKKDIYLSWKLAKNPDKQITILAQLNGVSRTDIEKIIESYKISSEVDMRKSSWSEQQNAILESDLKNGVSKHETAEKVGIVEDANFNAHYYYVRNRLIKEGKLSKDGVKKESTIKVLQPVYNTKITKTHQSAKKKSKENIEKKSQDVVQDDLPINETIANEKMAKPKEIFKVKADGLTNLSTNGLEEKLSKRISACRNEIKTHEAKLSLLEKEVNIEKTAIANLEELIKDMQLTIKTLNREIK